jgi:hypothetical protein
MFSRHHRTIVWMCGALFPALFIVLTEAEPKDPPARQSSNSDETQQVELQGTVICLAEEMEKQYHAELPINHEHIYGFKSNDGVFYTLLRTKFSEALFADERLRKKELIVKGRVFPKTQVLEVMGNLRSVAKGVVNDLYYYCDICAIQTVAPGRCMCCQEPVELVERPLSGAQWQTGWKRK